MNISNEISNKTSQFLSQHINWLFPEHSFKEVYLYSLLPAGKLFRPSLCIAVGLDLSHMDINDLKCDHPLALAGSALEVHHTYTLIHDDLPAMDNDDVRRGRPSSHKQFNEWKALLAGDGLLNASYRLLSKADHINTLTALRVFSWATGPKGLIQGQVLDLSEEMNKDFETLLLTHTLKTARLIQLSLLFGVLFSKNSNFSLSKKMWRLGLSMGISFQLLDDLSELTEIDPGEHEMSVNPWLSTSTLCSEHLKNHLNNLESILKEENLNHTSKVIETYLNKMKRMIKDGLPVIENHFRAKNIDPKLLPMSFIL